MDVVHRLLSRGARLPRAFTQPLEVVLTGAAFLMLHRLGLVGTLPIGVLVALLVGAGLVTNLVQHRWPSGTMGIRLHARLAVELLGTTAVVYAIGWGPTLAVGYVVVVAEDIRLCGARVWRPAMAWTLVGIAAGQAAIALGWAPTYVPAPRVHGLAILAGLGLAFVVRLLGLKSEALEDEEARRSVAEEAVRRSEQRFRSLAWNASDVVTVVNAEGRITYVSPSIERVMGHRPEVYETACGFDFIHPDDIERALDVLGTVLEHPGEDVTVELRSQHADGTWRWHEVTVRNLLDDEAVAGIVANHRDITERKAFHDRLAHEARHDSLTGLPNRKALIERMEGALARARRQRRGVALLFVDLDRFKLINDSLGHNLGDRLLAEVGRRLTACLRPEDTVARLGGDEFTALLEDVVDPSAVGEIAERLTAELRKPIVLGSRELVVTASVGAALSPLGEESAETLLCHADLAMYAAKQGGRARAAVYDRQATPQFVDRVDLEAALRSALARDEMVLHYQPIITMRDGQLSGFEALVRWRHPGRGLLTPASFIELAEETGLIVPIGRWVLEKACQTLARLERGRTGGAPLTMSVNVSAVQLHQHGFAAEVTDVLAATGLDPGSLVLEVTESVLLRAETNLGGLHDLHDRGVRIALDDFGTGYSSLAYLRRLPLDYVKIDRSFVAGLGSTGADTAIVQAIVDLAHTLGLATVAEGVETSEQARVLQQLRCGHAQGFLFGRPAERATGTLCVRPQPAVATLSGQPEPAAAASGTGGHGLVVA